MLHTLCYISSSKKELTKTDLEELYLKTKRNNLNLNISGILIHDHKNFFQILEGNVSEVRNLYNKITKDERHNHVIKIIDTKINNRVFEDYQTGFEIIDTFDKRKRFEKYLEWLKNAEIQSVDRVIKIIENFIDRSI